MTIEEILSKDLQKIQEERKSRERSGKWVPSLFGRCYRLQYFNRQNIPQTNPPDERTLRVFAAGNLFHKFIQDKVRDSQEIKVEGIEQKVETEDVCGYADIVTYNSVIDIKSQHSHAFWYMKKEIEHLDEEKPQDILQVSWYALQLKKEFARLVYISKDDLCMNEYLLAMTDERRKNIEFELGELNHYWKEKLLPDAEPRCYKDKKTGKLKECSFCGWKDLCKQTEAYKNKELNKEVSNG